MPAASLATLAVLTLLSFAAAVAGLTDMQFQIGAASACFTAVTAFGLAAGIRLLQPRTVAWYGVIVAAGVMVAVLIFSGWALGVPLALAAAAVGVGRRFGGSQAGDTGDGAFCTGGGAPWCAGRKPPPIRDARAAISRGAAPALAPARGRGPLPHRPGQWHRSWSS